MFKLLTMLSLLRTSPNWRSSHQRASREVTPRLSHLPVTHLRTRIALDIATSTSLRLLRALFMSFAT